MEKMTENEVVDFLVSYLEKQGWIIKDVCHDMEKGYDIIATKGSETLIIETKGARANKETSKRSYFKKEQIITHFGKAMTQTLEAMHKKAGTRYAIAHPDDPDIRKSIGHLVPFLGKLGITHYWVCPDGSVIES